MKKKAVVAIVMAALMVIGVSATAFAATGETTVKVEVTLGTPVTVSCEVPLVLAFSVNGQDNTVTVPTGYGIKNNSGAGTAIQVSKIQVAGVTGAAWTLKSTDPDTTGTTDAHKIQVKLQGAAGAAQVLPDLAAGSTLTADIAALPGGLDNIADGSTAALTLLAAVGGAVGTTYTTEEALADQFKIIYTVAKA